MTSERISLLAAVSKYKHENKYKRMKENVTVVTVLTAGSLFSRQKSSSYFLFEIVLEFQVHTSDHKTIRARWRVECFALV